MEEPGREPARRDPTPEPIADTLLALQRASGNKSVGALLARQPEEAEPADEKEGDHKPRAVVQFADPIGELKVFSFSYEPSRYEVRLTIPSTAHNREFLQYLASDTSIGHVKVSAGNFNLEIDNVYVAAVRMDLGDDIGRGAHGRERDVEEMVQLTLSFAPRKGKDKPKGSN